MERVTTVSQIIRMSVFLQVMLHIILSCSCYTLCVEVIGLSNTVAEALSNACGVGIAAGNVAEMTAEKGSTRSQLTASVSTSSDGQSTLEYFNLQFGGTVTKPISVTASTNEVRTSYHPQ